MPSELSDHGGPTARKGPSHSVVDHEFFRVHRLIPDQQEVSVISIDTSVREALEIMKIRGFSQLPVVGRDPTTGQKQVLGVFTFRSLAFNLHSVRRTDDPLNESVEGFVEDLEFFRATQDVGDVLTSIKNDSAVLIGSEVELLAVTTAEDVIQFLWDTTRPFVLLQDIELALRALMQSVLTTEEDFDICVERTRLHGGQGGKQPRRLSDLTLGDLLAVLFNDQNYGRYFNSVFGKNRDLWAGRMSPIGLIRNKVFHFRDSVSVEELQQLVDVRRQLERKIDAQRVQP